MGISAYVEARSVRCCVPTANSNGFTRIVANSSIWKVRDQVSESIDVQYGTDPLSLRCSLRFRKCRLQVIVNQFAEGRGPCALCQMRCGRSKYIPAVKRVTDRLKEVFLGRDLADFLPHFEYTIASTPLSGPMKYCPSASTRIARRAEPTPGSTTTT